MKLGPLVCLAALLLGADPGPIPLVGGTVRDQRGAPIFGARVTLERAGKGGPSDLTAADGTFVIEGDADRVRVTCAYCQALEVPVGADRIAIAIVHRYDVPRIEGASANDIAHLPYARPEQIFALAPFVVLNDSTRTIPGVTLRDRNAGYDGLLTVNGVPDYDFAGAISTYDTIPQGDVTSANVYRVDQAYRYGNVAQGGTFGITTEAGPSRAGYGNDALFRAGSESDGAYGDLAYSKWQNGDRRARATFGADFSTPGIAEDLSLSSGTADVAPASLVALHSSFSAARFSARMLGKTDAFGSLTVDRGSYAYSSTHFPADAVWSDAEFSAGITSHAAVAPFALFDSRLSTATYYSNVTQPDSAVGSLRVTRATAGISITQRAWDAVVAYGSTNGVYRVVTAPGSIQNANANDALLSVDLHPEDRWSLHASTSAGYTFATLIGIYAPAATGYPQPAERGDTSEATLTFTDSSRVSTAITTLAWRGSSGTATSSAGASVAWQIAPRLSVRSWLMHAQTRAGSVPSSALVGSTWLTYDNDEAFRADLIWGRDLLDGNMQGHLDGTLSGRFSPGVQWFAATEERQLHRAYSVGLQTFFTH